MISIPESGVIFGYFPADSCYQIEHSKGHKSLGDGFKMVEFTYLAGEKLFIVEAKSTIPKASSKPDYENFWNDIYEKFENALLLQLMGSLGRNQAAANELPKHLKQLNWEQATLQLRLVIPPVPNEFLPPLTETFRKRLQKISKQWSIHSSHLFVINENKARQEGLLV